MSVKPLVKTLKPKLADIAKLLAAGKQPEALKRFAALIKGMPAGSDPRLPKVLAGLIVLSVRSRQTAVNAPRKFEDPLTAFEDPLTAFEDPLTAFEDPLTAFDNPVFKRMVQSLLKAV